MSTRLLILTSMILHMVTFIALALGSIYELKWLTFGSLVTLALGIYFGKETLERLDYEDLINTNERIRAECDEEDEDPPSFIG